MGRTTTSSSSDLHLASLLDFRLQVVHKIEDTGVPGRVQYQIEDIFIIHYSLFMPNNGGASESGWVHRRSGICPRCRFSTKQREINNVRMGLHIFFTIALNGLPGTVMIFSRTIFW